MVFGNFREAPFYLTAIDSGIRLTLEVENNEFKDCEDLSLRPPLKR